MGLFSKGICPICESNTNMLIKSSTKYGDDYLCQECLNKILKSNIFITKIKNKSLEELKEIVNNFYVNKEIDKINQQQQNEYLQQRNDKKTIKQVIIIANQSDSRKKIGSSILRGTVGGMALGPVGLVGGALSGKNKVTSKTTFLIEYQDGHKETKIVDTNSSEFNKLCKYIKM